jgi:hypothetical protein
MQELGHGGGMSWGMGGVFPACRDPDPRPCCGDPPQ